MQDNSFFNECSHLDQVLNLSTYLSDEVNDIIKIASSSNANIAAKESMIYFDPWLQKDNLILNYEFLARECLEFEREHNLNELNFKKSLTNLKKYFQPIKENILKFLDCSRHTSLIFGVDLEFFKNNVFNQLHSYLQSKDKIHLHISFLNLFLMFERSLGDLIYSFNSGNSCTIPFLLKDLAYDKVVLTILGKPLCDLLAIFIYTPRSLNLRNLIWHGFWQPNELNEDCIFFLISIITSINGILSNKISNKTIKSFKQRPKLNLNEFSKRDLKNAQLLENFSHKYNQECMLIIQNSKLIDSKEIWLKAFSGKENHFDIIILLLPQIEHILRKLYSLYNRDSQCQIAMVDEYYLTIDDLLMFDDKKNLKKNILIDKLDPHLILFSNELFMYEDGPRLRDRASHGELNQREIPKHFADCVQFLSIFLASIPLDLKNDKNLVELDLFKQKFYSEYDSIHHPISVLKKKVYLLIEINEDLNSSKTDIYTDSDALCFKNECEEIFLSRKNLKFDLLKKDSLELHWKITDIYSFVYRYDLNKDFKSFKSNEIQLIKILIKIFDQMYKVLETVKEFLKQAILTTNDHLRQRKRENVDSFFKNKYYFEIFFELSLSLLIYFIENVIIQKKFGNMYSTYNSIEFTRIIKYYKNFLKIIENLNSKSSSNKWTECKNLIVENKVNLFSNFLEILFF